MVAAALVTKLIGLFYKIPLLSLVGVEGMAYFLAAYHLYSLLFVIAAAGLPTALSLLVARAVAAGRERAVRRIFGVALLLFFTLGAAGSVCLFVFARPLAAKIAMPQAWQAIVAIAPALLLGAVSGAVRGYFQGFGNMVPTAVSEVVEAAGKLICGILFSLAARRAGADIASLAAAAVFGITAGMVPAVLYLGIRLAVALLHGTPQGGAVPARGKVLAQLVRVALPVTVSASVMSFVSLVDTALISGRLQALGFAPSVANALYSSYGNLAVPLYNLVPSLLSPLTLALTPLLAGALERREHAAAKEALGASLRLTALAAIPAAFGLCVFARPILFAVYRGQNEAIAVAAPLLSLLALSVLPAVFVTLTGAALQAAGHERVPVLSMAAGALVKLLTEWALFAVPRVGIKAAPVSTLACQITVLAVNAAVLSRVLPFRVSPAADLARPLLAATLATGVGVGAFCALRRAGAGEVAALFPAVALVMIAYALLALRAGAVREEDVLALPSGERISQILKKSRLWGNGYGKQRKNQGTSGKKGIYRRRSGYDSNAAACPGRVPVGQGTDAPKHP